MARRTAWLFLASLLIPAGSARAQSIDTLALRSAIAQVGGRVIIALKSGRGASLLQSAGAQMPATQMASIEQRITRQYPLSVHGRAAIASALFATIADSDVARVLADSNVGIIVPDQLGQPAGAASVPRAAVAETTPWGVADVAAPKAWSAGVTGAGIKVGIIDGGIDYTNPDLNVVGGYDLTTSSGAPSAYTDNIASCGGHGTHVAGTVGAKLDGQGVVGVAPGVSLYALKVFQDMSGSCLAWESNQIAALNWAATNGIRVVNISIGNSSYNPIYQNAITSAIAAGVTVVASAGNNSGGAVVYPGAYAGVIAVGALDQGNTPASYESVGPQMWIAAPGTNILSTLPGGTTGFKSGTSMAAPHVVGVAALLLQANPTWTPAQVQAAIKASAIDLGAPGFDNSTGWGLVQAPTGGSGSIPVTVAVSPGARSASVAQGSAAPGDNATVTLAGTNAATTAWSATKKKSWTTLTTASGTGSGTLAWSRSSTGLGVGTYVDTLTVTVTVAGATPAVLYDTLKITAVVIPITLAVSPAGRNTSVPQGGVAPSGSATVSMGGTNAWATPWVATKRQRWTTFTAATGSGNGSIAWTRNAAGLTPGSYVDTLTVTAAGIAPGLLYDTLTITPARSVATGVSASPHGFRTRVIIAAGLSTSVRSDSVTIEPSGASVPDTLHWIATTAAPWMALTTSQGSVSDQLRWSRNAVGLGVGSYVDSIVVSLVEAPDARAVVMDTLDVINVVLPAPDVAAQELFTPGQLTDDQRDALDQIGNHNGRYDIGDFLSWVQRANIRLSASLRKQLLTLPVAPLSAVTATAVAPDRLPEPPRP
ncbi:MAG: S8 family serine peptidase [Gemmatimonadales bacterium]